MTSQKKIEALEKQIAKLEEDIKKYNHTEHSDLYFNIIDKENFLNKIPIGIVVFEILNNNDISKNKILDVNKHFEEISGLSKEQLLNKNITELIDKIHLPSNLYTDVLEKNKIIKLKTSLKDEEKHFHIAFFRLNRYYLIASFNDYTRLKEAEDTILFERNLFQTLLNKFPDAIFFKDKEARFLRASIYLTEDFHTTPNEIIGKTDFDFYDKKLAEKKFEDDMSVINTGIPIINKEEKGNPAGKVIKWYSTTKLPLFNRKGEIEGLFGISRDITEKKLAEVKELDYKNNLITLSESAINLLKIDSKKEIFDSLCKTLEKQFKHSVILYSITSETQNKLEISSKSDDHKEIRDILNKCNIIQSLREDKTFNKLLFKGKIISCNRDIKDIFIIDEIKKKFDELNIKHKYLFCITENNNIIGSFIILMKNGLRLIDKNFVETFIQQSSLIIHRKNLEEQLIIEKERAEESDNLKSSFLANLSHEIRTPINAIQGFGELLKSDDLPIKKKTEYIEIIQEKSNQLIQIIADIIDISKFEANQVKVSESEDNLNEFLLNIIKDFKFRLSNYLKKDIPLHLEKGLPDDQGYIKTDFSLVKQVIANLITNAIKFTHQGIIELGYKVQEDQLLFYVQDTGIGIPKEKREIIFARFRQVDESRTRKYGGTGLGLTISKSIIELMNGKIWVENSKYEDFSRQDILDKCIAELKQKDEFGAKFIFTIPFKPVKVEVSKEIDIEISSDWSNKNILVVEDDSFNYHYIYEVLEANNPQIVHCKNGKEAVSYFIENKNNIDIIIMDLQMPVMDGYEATKLIREYSQKIPIIVQTAYSMPEDINKARESGATDYVVKPYNSNELVNKIAKYI